MSFRHTFYYVTQAKREIYDCTEIDADFADLLFTDPYVYRNPEFISNRIIHDDQHELSIKLLFLCDMRQEYNEHFFGGNAPLTADFFDQWWTLTKTDAAQDVSDVVARIRPDDFSTICSQFLEEMVTRLNGDW
ncbi:hypothetical protein [Rhodopirellula bahusiensis]|uniref:hypothetical protein n=1 Tax=Rhodopirellula bahusiensis TaxID=2014065 RepID=UPI003267A59A